MKWKDLFNNIKKYHRTINNLMVYDDKNILLFHQDFDKLSKSNAELYVNFEYSLGRGAKFNEDETVWHFYEIIDEDNNYIEFALPNDGWGPIADLPEEYEYWDQVNF